MQSSNFQQLPLTNPRVILLEDSISLNKRTSLRTVSSSPSLLPAAASFSSSGPLLVFRRSLPSLLLFYCIPGNLSPKSYTKQSPDSFLRFLLSVDDNFKPFSSTSLLIDFRTFSAIPANTLFRPSMEAAMSSTKTLSFRDGYTFLLAHAEASSSVACHAAEACRGSYPVVAYVHRSTSQKYGSEIVANRAEQI